MLKNTYPEDSVGGILKFCFKLLIILQACKHWHFLARLIILMKLKIKIQQTEPSEDIF